MALNKWIGIGRLTKDPELKTTGNGNSVCSFSIAVNRPYRKGAEREADFINVAAWRATAEFVTKYFAKGDPIQVVGSLQSRKYQDKDGVERQVYEIVADDVSFVEGAGKNGTPAQKPVQTVGAEDEMDEVDFDLPF